MLVYCSCSPLLLWQTLDPSPSIVPSFQPWKHMMILKMVIVSIIHIIPIIAITCIYWHYDSYAYYINYCWLISCRMVGVCWIACGIGAWLQKTYPVRPSHSEYPGQTSFGACRWHRYYPTQHAQRLFGCSRRPEAGRSRWMPDVIRHLVGIGMVPWPVLKLTGLQPIGAMPQGEKVHVNTTHRHVWGVCSGCADDSNWFSQ